jgi:hypothetical protein
MGITGMARVWGLVGVPGRVLEACELKGRVVDMGLRSFKPLPSFVWLNGATFAKSFKFAARGTLPEPPDSVRWWPFDECGCWD